MRFSAVLLLLAAAPLSAQPVLFPTPNRALLERDGAARFYTPTTGRTWESGCFGCVRSDGWQMHEGLDIRCVQRDRRGEPRDTVSAAVDGTVAYINTRSGLSNYGKYVVLRHKAEGFEYFTLYAHLAEFRPGLRTGVAVRAGEALALMGRTSNTRETISKERAHLHFEINLQLNDRFSDWFKKENPKERNDHGNWNGQNLVGVDPRLALLQSHRLGKEFSLMNVIRSQTEMCRVLVRQANLPFAKRHPALVRRNPLAEKEGVAAHEIALNFNGLPFQITPRTRSEIAGTGRFQVLSVNEPEQRRNPCRKIVVERNGRWELGAHGQQLVELLAH